VRLRAARRRATPARDLGKMDPHFPYSEFPDRPNVGLHQPRHTHSAVPGECLTLCIPTDTRFEEIKMLWKCAAPHGVADATIVAPGV
jgi:hypothetical protein